MPSRRAKSRKATPAVDVEAEATAPQLRVCEVELPDNLLPFRRWLVGLRDSAARARILMRIDRIITAGNFGDHRERIMGAVSELRIDYGPGYRVYYARHGDVLVVLVGGGTKDGQQNDFEAAHKWELVRSDVERYSRDAAS